MLGDNSWVRKSRCMVGDIVTMDIVGTRGNSLLSTPKLFEYRATLPHCPTRIAPKGMLGTHIPACPAAVPLCIVSVPSCVLPCKHRTKCKKWSSKMSFKLRRCFVKMWNVLKLISALYYSGSHKRGVAWKGHQYHVQLCKLMGAATDWHRGLKGAWPERGTSIMYSGYKS